jgi:hypothetical protein
MLCQTPTVTIQTTVGRASVTLRCSSCTYAAPEPVLHEGQTLWQLYCCTAVVKLLEPRNWIAGAGDRVQTCALLCLPDVLCQCAENGCLCMPLLLSSQQILSTSFLKQQHMKWCPHIGM